MKKIAFTTAALCAAVFLLTLLTLPPRAAILPAGPANADHPVIAGAFHVHTVRSDGTGTVDEVAAAAQKAGLSFVVFTDHGDGTRQPDLPAYRSGVLCIDGVEVSTAGGHYAAIGMNRAPYPLGGEPRDVVEDVSRLGGFGIAAHPDSPKVALQWHAWDVPFDAVEWLNGDSGWRAKSPLGLARVLLDYPFRGPESLGLLLGRSDEVLKQFDALTTHRRVVTIGAADAHARLGWRRGEEPYAAGGAYVKSPSYEMVFRTFAVRAQLDRRLTGRPFIDWLLLRSAIAAGHVYTGIDALATPPEIDFTGTSGAFSARGGDTLQIDGPVNLHVRVNSPRARVLLFENGRQIAEGQSEVRVERPARPAVFRAQADLLSGSSWVPWIVGNPIYVGGAVEARPAQIRPDATVTTALLPVDPAWQIEREKTSSGQLSGAPAALDFQFSLGGGSRAAQYAALVHPLQGLEGKDRVQVRASAERPMRISVQLRTSGQGDARWIRSVYLDREPRDITVFFDDMRPATASGAAHPDVSKVNSLMFVVDTVNTAPGTSGAVHLEDLRLMGTGR